MLKVNLICIGDIKEKYLKDAIEEYKKRLNKFVSLNIIELKENVPTSNSAKDIENALNKDALQIKKYVKGYSICLDIDAKQYSSEEFSSMLAKLMLTNGEISFVIGASNGISQELKQQSNNRISFSKMTFPHQLMRVIFLEQLYRAFTILNNIAYHK